MSDSPAGDAPQDEVKPYCDDVYAATPSSGSGGGDVEEDDNDYVDANNRTEQVDRIEAICDFLQIPNEDNSNSVSEWVNQLSTFDGENTVEGQEELLTTAECLKHGEDTTYEEQGVTEGDVLDNSLMDTSEGVTQESQEAEDSSKHTFKIFVSNLPPGLSTTELTELFIPHGEVAECEIFAKNYAFVHMASEESGIKALEQLNGLDLRGCKINVKRSVHTGHPLNAPTAPKKRSPLKTRPEPKPKPAEEELQPVEGLEIGTFKLYCGNLPEDVTKEYVADLLKPFGRTVEIELYRNTAAFVHMETEESANKAIQELHGQTLPDCEKAMIVSASKNPEGPSLPTIKLLVKNISTTILADELRSLFTPYGLVLKVAIRPKILANGCRTGIVQLEQFGNIRSAIKELNGKEVGGSAIHVEATFDKPDKPKQKPTKPTKSFEYTGHRPSRPSFNNEDSYGWAQQQPQDDFPPAEPEPYGEWTPVKRMRLIPMPSQADLRRFPGKGRGRRLVRPEVPPPPPLMGRQPFPTHSSWGGYDNYDAYNDGGYDEVLNDGFGGGYSNHGQNEDYNSFNEYGWDQQTDANEYNQPSFKVPRNKSWNNSQKFGGKSGQQNSGWGKPKNNNYNNGRNSNNFKSKKGVFPQMPSAEEFPKVPQSLMSAQVPSMEDYDWSADLPISNFSGYSNNQVNEDFASDDFATTSTLNAVPFDYSQMRKKKNFSANWQQNSNPKTYSNPQGSGKNKSGKAKKGNSRRPGLGSSQQQKKIAHQMGNDEPESCSAQPGEWQAISGNSLGGGDTQSASSSAYAPSYFQQNWSFSKGKQKQNNKKPTPKQLKEAEEEQKRQYADYLKQKPWLYQAIPGTVKKVQK